MTDKDIDNLFTKQEIKLSASFNESLFSRIENDAKDLDNLFSMQNLSLDNAFNDKVIDDARIDNFFAKDKLKLNDEFCDSIFANIEKQSALEMPRKNIWNAIFKISGVAAALIGGIFIASTHFNKEDLIPVDSNIYQIAEENINTEINYFLFEDDMNKLSQEIDSLEASILELESYNYTTASAGR